MAAPGTRLHAVLTAGEAEQRRRAARLWRSAS